MDRMIKTVVLNEEFSLAVLDTTDMVNEAIELHSLSPLSAAALGRTLTAATYMCGCMKNETDKLSVTISGGGQAGQIIVSGNGKLEMRGSIDNKNGEMPLKRAGKLDVGGFVGKDGRLSVVRDLGLKEPYVGTSRLVSGEIAEDFTAYFALSEQIPTAMALGVLIGTDGKCTAAGGVVLQAMPYATEENLIKAEKIMNGFSEISKMIKEKPLEDIIIDSFGGENLFYKQYLPVYKCVCSRDYLLSVLKTVQGDELDKMFDEDGKIEVDCQFCEKKYVFYKSDLQSSTKEK